MDAKVIQILDNVQTGTFNHQKNIKLLENVYNSVKFEEFSEYYLRIIQGVLQEDYKNSYFRLLLEFLAKFVGYIARVQGPQDVSELEDDPPTHPFLTAVIEEVIRHHSLPIPECRYNACTFMSLTLQNIGDKTQMDSHICDVIQTAMLENIQDFKPEIRLQAVLALVRLQDPLNPDCPVIRAYIDCLKDSSSLVRREASRRIAPNALTIPKLKAKTRDKDPNVRSAAFTHVAEIGIRHFKIVHRQFILKSGFTESHKNVKKVFLEYLLPKWLTVLNGEYIAFLTAIKLDGEESDVLKTEELSQKIMGVFFQTEPIASLIGALPLDENKVIPFDRMRTELSHYWKILTNHLRKSEEMDEYLDEVIPELGPFCNYLDKLISTKFSKTMEDWEYLDFQYMLYHLFDIAENYDLSEEVGRGKLDNLLKKVLRNHRLQPRLLNKIVQLASKLASSTDSFINEMCLIIYDIREPLMEQEPSIHEKREREFKIAELTVKINILEGDLEDAIADKDFQKAQVFNVEIEECRRKMEDFKTLPSQATKVRVSKDDSETVCWCLDLLTALLINSNLKTLSPSLVACRDEFFKPLMANKNVEIGWRVFKCLATYCVFDKQMAEEHVKQLMVPIASYRVIPNFNKNVLIASISVISDLIRLHGTELFATEDDNNTTSSTQISTRRRLYNEEEVEDVGTINNQMTVEVIVNVLLDMLDDENQEIRDTSVLAIAKLVLSGFTINAMVMTRLILKWYNPAIQKALQQSLGMVIKEYTDTIKESKQIVAKSVIPILTNIANAPRTSPLAEVDIENVSRFLAAISDSDQEITHVHRDIAHILIREIAARPAEVVTHHLAKMLNVLNLAPDDSPPTKELIGQAELVLEREALDKGPKQHIMKFVSKLKGNLEMVNSVRQSNSTNRDTTDHSINTTKNTTVPRRLSSVIEDQEEEIEATDSEETNGDALSKKRKINTEKSTAKETPATNGVKLSENSQDSAIGNKDVEAARELSNAAQADASVRRTSELIQNQTNTSGNGRDIVSPSISPDSQDTTINNLRKRTRSHNNVGIAPSKKKKVETERRTKRNDTGEREGDNTKGKANNKEARKDVEASSEESSEKNDTERPDSNEKSRDKSNDKENNRIVKKVNGKNKDSSGNRKKNTGGKSLQIVLINITPNTLRTSLRRQNRKESGRTDKEISSKSEESSTDSSRVDKTPRVRTSRPNPNRDLVKCAIANHMVRKQNQPDNVSSSSESVTSDKSKRKGGKRTENGSLQTRSVMKGKRNNLTADILQRSVSESSLSTRSSSKSTSLTPTNGAVQPGRKGRGGSSSRSNSSSLSSTDVVTGYKLRSGDGSSSRNTRLDKRKETERPKSLRRPLFVNDNIPASQSSVSDEGEPNKGSAKRRGRKKKGERLNNNVVGGNKLETRTNGVRNAVLKSIDTPQVKRKKVRGHVAKIAREPSIQVNDDSSDQSLHTICEASDISMCLLPDTPESSPRKSSRYSRRMQVVVSETSSDPESSGSPIRKSLRRK